MTYTTRVAKGSLIGLLGFTSVLAMGTGAHAVDTATTTSTTTAPVSAAAACVGKAAIASAELLVDGVAKVPFEDTKTFVPGGSTVTVNFTVAPGCDPTAFGLAGYLDPVPTADPTNEEVMQQTLLVSQTTTVAGGQSGSLTIQLPIQGNCYYQVDFFTGAVISQFAIGNFYGHPEPRLITAVHLQRPNCVEVLETTTTTSTSTTSTSTSTTSTTVASVSPNETDVRPEQTESTQPPEVLGEVAENTTNTTLAEVLNESLARTGVNTFGLAAGAGLLALAGGSLRTAAVMMRRRRAADRH